MIYNMDIKNINFSRKDLEALREDPIMLELAEIFNVDLSETIDNAIKELDKQEQIKKRAKDIISEMEKSKVQETKKSEPNNIPMTFEQFKKFIEDYSELLNMKKKVEYWYGIKFGESYTGSSLSSKVREIIWDLVRIIFGEDNRADIADYLYGNSNFDSPKALYDELT